MPEENTSEDWTPEKDNHTQSIPEPSPPHRSDPQPDDSRNTEKAEGDDIIKAKKLIASPENVQKSPAKPTTTPISASEERTWAMLAHLSILLNLVTGFLGIFAAILIYFIYKDRSRLVAYHAMQSFIFQAITWIGAGILSGTLIAFGSVLGFLIIPLLCLIPGFLILLLIPASLIYGIIGAVQVNNSEDFKYWQVGDWVREILDPKPIP